MTGCKSLHSMALLAGLVACTGSGPTGGVEAIIPYQPLGVTAVPGNGFATVSWLVPKQSQSATEANVIIEYKVTSNPGGVMATCAGNVYGATVTGLTNGTSYTFTVVAVNAAGDSTPSDPSNAVIPAGIPGAPTNVAALGAGEDSATVTWDAPADNGGSPLLAFIVTAIPEGVTGGQSYTVEADKTTATLSDLNDAIAYTFTVVAVNSIGQGPSSTSSDSVTTVFPPGPPTQVSATTESGDAVTVYWNAPADNGGSFVSAYTITPYIGMTAGTPVMTDGATPTVTFPGLMDGATYTFQVVAVNLAGTSATAAVSDPVVPSMSGN